MVILHAFNWKYDKILNHIEQIAGLGYSAILIPPPLYSEPEGKDWWQRYQPKDYRILLSALGNKKELEQIINKARKYKLQIYADIVINHMANEDRSDPYRFPGRAELEKYTKKPEIFETNKLYGDLSKMLFEKEHFHRRGKIQNWAKPDEVIFHSLGDLPDLNESDYVLEKQRELVENLLDFGFDGFRIDAVKHITEKQIDNIADLEIMQDKFLFGEVLTISEEDRDKYMQPFLNATHMSAYDFPLFNTLRKSFAYGGSLRRLAAPDREGNALNKFRSISFTVNHDLPHNEGFRPLMLEKQDEHLATAYIMGRDGGVPLIYSDNNESAHYPEDRNRWADMFKREDIVRMLKFHNAVHSLPQYELFQDDDMLAFRRGDKAFVIINKSGNDRYLNIWTFGLKNPAKYTDCLHEHTIEFKGEHIFPVFIPPRTAQMWLAEE